MLSIRPRDKEFFLLFEEAGSVLVRAAEAYNNLVRDYPQRERYVAAIRQLEHDGDDVARRTFHKLDTTFITPFDREDIYSLMKRMDDVVDEIDASAKRLILYRIPEPTSRLAELTDILLRACRCVAAATGELRNLKKPDELRAHLVQIRELENAGDDANHAAAAELYATATNAIDAMKWKEIYDLTERALDRCEDIANVIEAIVLKNS